MSIEANRTLIQRFYDEGWTQNNLDVYDELVNEDFEDHQALPGLPPGREGFKMLNVMFRSAFPDLRVDIDNVVAEDDKVGCRWRSTGTHQGELFGIPPTGKTVKFTEMGILRVADGKVVESWYDVDMLGMMQQLGVIPSP